MSTLQDVMHIAPYKDVLSGAILLLANNGCFLGFFRSAPSPERWRGKSHIQLDLVRKKVYFFLQHTEIYYDSNHCATDS